MNYLQTRLCELTHSSFYTVYNQPDHDISDVSSSRKRSLRLVETAEIQASFESPFFSCLVEDGDRRCDLIWASPVTLHFFPLCVLKRCSPLYFEPKPNLSKTLKGLLMRLVIFENTIFQLNSLIITLSVCYISGSKVNRKERSRPSLLAGFFVPPC